jgi:hypothetical protein
MLGKFVARLRRPEWGRWAAAAGAFVSRRKGLGAALLFGGALGLVVLLVHREIYSFIASKPQYSVPRIDAALAPRWADRQGAELVRVETEGASLFDDGLVERVGRSFEECPWIARVTAVERVFPNQLRVRFEYRRAHAAVRRPNGHVVLVDAAGVRLPGVYLEPPTCDRAAVVSGVPSAPPAPGRTWDDPALRAGLAMADFAVDSPLLRRLGVREVDVSNFGGRVDARRSEVTLVTSAGCQVQWGRTAAAPRYGDPSDAEKLELLRDVMADYPDLRGLRSVKLYFKGSRAVEPADSTTVIRRAR